MDKKARNVTWNQDELILALDLYFREPRARGNKRHPETIALSMQLNKMAKILGRTTGPRYRNPSGISMTLNTFLRYDPDYRGRGLRGGRQVQQVWNTFVNDRDHLTNIATAIRENLSNIDLSSTLPFPEQLEDGAVEGQLLSMLHHVRERDPKIVARKKHAVLRQQKALACEVCAFDFEKTFGSRGLGYAECHHEKPLSSLRNGERTNLSDLRILCANCHRMIHRARPWLSVNDLRKLISRQHAAVSTT